MRYKSLTKWMKWVSDSKRAVGVKEDEAHNQTGQSLQAGTDPRGEQPAFNPLHADNECSLTLFPFLTPPPSSVFHPLAPHHKYLNSCPFFPLSHAQHFLALPCTSQTLIRALRRAPGSENNGSARRVEPKVCSIIKMVFF